MLPDSKDENFKFSKTPLTTPERVVSIPIKHGTIPSRDSHYVDTTKYGPVPARTPVNPTTGLPLIGFETDPAKRNMESPLTYEQVIDQHNRDRFILSSDQVKQAEALLRSLPKECNNPKDSIGSKKSPLSLVPPSVIIHLAEAFREGAEKYGAYNWRTKKVQSLIYCDAIMRHLLAYIDGEDIDQESKKHHLDGVLASAGILIDATETGNLIDNRPVKGNASELLTKYTRK